MKIIIAGAGKVGHSIAASLSMEGHDITVIDRNADTIMQISNELDVICVEGSATNPETLREPGLLGQTCLLPPQSGTRLTWYAAYLQGSWAPPMWWPE